jgi:aminoglycoside N3'-acetyltransferase
MGCIAELFRTLPESIRSNHPQVSFSASGKYANVIIDNHQLTPQFGMNTPLGKLYELNAKVLLLGVNYVLGEIGNAKCRIFNMKTGVDFAGKWLEKNRFNT